MFLSSLTLGHSPFSSRNKQDLCFVNLDNIHGVSGKISGARLKMTFWAPFAKVD